MEPTHPENRGVLIVLSPTMNALLVWLKQVLLEMYDDELSFSLCFGTFKKTALFSNFNKEWQNFSRQCQDAERGRHDETNSQKQHAHNTQVHLYQGRVSDSLNFGFS